METMLFNVRAAFLSKQIIYFIVALCHVYLMFHTSTLLLGFTFVMDILFFLNLLVQLPDP